MIEFNPNSLFTVMLMASVCLLLYMLVSSNSKVISRLPMWITILFTIAVCIRILIPVENTNISKAICSFVIFPKVKEFLIKDIAIFNTIHTSIGQLIYVTWALGCFVLLINYIIGIFRLHKIIKRIPQIESKSLNILKALKKEYGFKFETKLIQSNIVTYPAECGFLKQAIFLNAYDYTEEELRYILLHELVHFKYGTNWMNLFINIVYIIFWWNPIIYLYKKHFNCLIEIYVDNKVIKLINNECRVDYIKCLFKVFELIDNTDTKKCRLVNSFVEDNSNTLLFKRFKIIKENNKSNKILCTVILFFACGFWLLSGIFVIQPAYEPPPEDLSPLNVEFNTANSFIKKENDYYVLYYEGKPLISHFDIKDFTNVPIIN